MRRKQEQREASKCLCAPGFSPLQHKALSHASFSVRYILGKSEVIGFSNLSADKRIKNEYRKISESGKNKVN